MKRTNILMMAALLGLGAVAPARADDESDLQDQIEPAR